MLRILKNKSLLKKNKAISLNGMAFFICFFIVSSIYCQNGIWVVRYTLNSDDQCKELISTASSLNINDIYLQVFAKGQAWYPTKTSFPSIKVKHPSCLKKIIEFAHKKDIKIHAWINVLNIWSGKKNPKNKNHLFYLKEKDILNVPNGVIPATYKEIVKSGNEGYFLDPSDISISDIYFDLFKELIDVYNVDGIHLDYFRYPKNGYHFSKKGRTEFMKVFYTDPEIYFTNNENKNSDELQYNYYVDKYQRFMRENLSLFLKKINADIKNLNKNIKISIAVKPDMKNANTIFFQDWNSWLENKYCDYVVLMNYETDFIKFRKNAQQAGKWIKNGRALVGVSTYNQDADKVVKRLKYLHEQGIINKTVFFSYNYLMEHPSYLRNIREYVTQK